MCKSSSIKTSSKCELSIYGCEWHSYGEGSCKFKDNECDKKGQNYTSCMDADDYCLFANGECKSIKNLNLLGCTSGLNKQACINLSNPS